MLVVYPNQKIVTVHKEPADKNHLYGVLNKEALFLACRNLKQNELKVFLYLAFNQAEYQMAMSSADIAEKIGSTEDGVRAAVRGLQKKEYLIKDHGNVYDFYEVPQSEAEAEDGLCNEKMAVLKTEKPALSTGKSSVYEDERKGEIIKEEYSKNTINYIDDSGLSNQKFISKEWKEIFGRIKVQCYTHTMKRLENAVGTELDARVVRKIVNDNWSAFENGMFEKEGYRLKTLVNLLEANYTKYKYVIAAQDAEYKRAIEESRNRPRINYNLLCASRMEEPEGLGDISALLDEMFEDDVV